MDYKPIAPKYYVIKQTILDWIKNGKLKDNDMLPSEKQLTETFDVSRITVRKALDELNSEGYVYKIQGRGTFVKGNGNRVFNLNNRILSRREEIRQKGMEPSIKIIHSEIILATEECAKLLNINEGDEILSFDRIYYGDGIPVVYSDGYINCQMLPGIENYELDKNSLMSVARQEYNLDIENTYRTFEAISATGKLAEYLQVENGYPVLKIRSLSKCRDMLGHIATFEYCTNIYRCDKLLFTTGEI